jgi:hypothetical protein
MLKKDPRPSELLRKEQSQTLILFQYLPALRNLRERVRQQPAETLERRQNDSDVHLRNDKLNKVWLLEICTESPSTLA